MTAEVRELSEISGPLFATAREWHRLAAELTDSLEFRHLEMVADGYFNWIVEMHEVACHNARESFKAAVLAARGAPEYANQLLLRSAPMPPRLPGRCALAY